VITSLDDTARYDIEMMFVESTPSGEEPRTFKYHLNGAKQGTTFTPSLPLFRKGLYCLSSFVAKPVRTTPYSQPGKLK
jgi:hypothetical protein